MSLSSSRPRGFTLLELMVVLLVMAILAMIAFTSYSRYAFRARRADGQKQLMAIGNAEERYYALHNAYADLATIGYSATSTPVATNSQARDACGALTLTDTGVKGQSGTTSNGSCW